MRPKPYDKRGSEGMLKLYHAEPGANSLKSLIPLKEKGLDFQSIYKDRQNCELVRLHTIEFCIFDHVG